MPIFSAFTFVVCLALAKLRLKLRTKLYILLIISFVLFSCYDLQSFWIFVAVLVINLFLHLRCFTRFNPRLAIIVNLIALSGSKLLYYYNHIEYLPLGVSFYCIQFIGYWILKRENFTISHFMNFMSFFPQLFAGPIANYSRFRNSINRNLLTCSTNNYRFGVTLIALGFFKKFILSDNLEIMFFNDSASIIQIFIFSMMFSIKLYLDFSGYSDLARGFGKLFGLDLPINFNYPYLSRNFTDFWKRWHITLTEFLRVGVFEPLARYLIMRRVSYAFVICLSTTFIVSAVWHGLGMWFMLFGIFNILGLILDRYLMNVTNFVTLRLPLNHAFIIITHGFFGLGVYQLQIQEVIWSLGDIKFSQSQLLFTILGCLMIYYERNLKYILRLCTRHYTFEAFLILLLSVPTGMQTFIYFEF